MRKIGKRLAVPAVLGAAMATANAATDITGVITDVTGYVNAAIVVGISVLLFVLGRRAVRKLI